MVVHPQTLAVDAQHVRVPAHPLLAPVLEGLVVLVRADEVLHLHELEFANPKDKIARRDLVAERLALLRDAERHAYARRADHVLEIDEHALRRLGSQVHLGRRVLDGPHVRLEHQVEHPRLVERAAAFRAFVALHVVGPPAPLAYAQALPQRVDEVLQVATGLPDLFWHDQRRFQAHHVVAQVDHVPPPQIADRPLQRHAVRAVVVEARQPAVDLARRVDEAAALGQRHDLVHQLLARDGHPSFKIETMLPAGSLNHAMSGPWPLAIPRATPLWSVTPG